jgi:hypothetical protein
LVAIYPSMVSRKFISGILEATSPLVR